jgi:hypothetical protein
MQGQYKKIMIPQTVESAIEIIEKEFVSYLIDHFKTSAFQPNQCTLDSYSTWSRDRASAIESILRLLGHSDEQIADSIEQAKSKAKAK